MEIILGVLAVAAVFGISLFALWHWREYVMGYLIGGGLSAGSTGDSEGGSKSDGATSSDGGTSSGSGCSFGPEAFYSGESGRSDGGGGDF